MLKVSWAFSSFTFLAPRRPPNSARQVPQAWYVPLDSDLAMVGSSVRIWTPKWRATVCLLVSL